MRARCEMQKPLVFYLQVLGIHDRGGARAVLLQRSTENNQARLQRLTAHLAQHRFMFRIDVNQFWQVGSRRLSNRRVVMTYPLVVSWACYSFLPASSSTDDHAGPAEIYLFDHL